MDLDEAIYNRRSTRFYHNKPIPDEDIRKIIDAGIQAPSACNHQLWRFIVITDPDVKKKLVDAGAAVFIKNSPVCIITIYYSHTENTEYHDNYQSASAANMNMLLKAFSMGIGCTWINHLPKKSDVRRILNIPRYFTPISAITLGYPSQPPKERPRKFGPNEVISYNKYNFPKPETSINRAKAALRKVYFLMPVWLKKLTRPYVEKKHVKRFE